MGLPKVVNSIVAYVYSSSMFMAQKFAPKVQQKLASSKAFGGNFAK
jgi:hypothetical protein